MGNLADTLRVQGQYPEAEKLLRQLLDIMRPTLGEPHSDYLANLNALGNVLLFEKRYPEAEQLFTKALESQRRVLGDAHPDTADSAYNLAEAQALEGKREEAFKNLQFALDHGLRAESRDGLEKDTVFQSLHGTARFDALVAGARKPPSVAKN